MVNTKDLRRDSLVEESTVLGIGRNELSPLVSVFFLKMLGDGRTFMQQNTTVVLKLTKH